MCAKQVNDEVFFHGLRGLWMTKTAADVHTSAAVYDRN